MPEVRKKNSQIYRTISITQSPPSFLDHISLALRRQPSQRSRDARVYHSHHRLQPPLRRVQSRGSQ